uniref:Uncharacterized protein n=1 Tax=Kalanchoe fedtschenkoi TaxID=63787 RepID=A0A7N0UHN1_KALFE
MKTANSPLLSAKSGSFSCWHRPRKTSTWRRRVCTQRLGSQPRGMFVSCRPVVRWTRVVASSPVRLVSELLLKMTENGGLIDAYYRSTLPVLISQVFPLC